jgi:hypothetical protein
MAYPIPVLAKIMATARDRSAVMMGHFLVGGVIACNFGSDDNDDKDDDNIFHFNLRGPAAAVRYQTHSTEFPCVHVETHPKIGFKIR